MVVAATTELAKNSAVPGLTSIIIVAANSGDDLVECVRCVLASALTSSLIEIIVSDNDSQDNSIEQLSKRFPMSVVRILHNGRNLGFGAACNRASALACGDVLLFLNPDCFIAPDSIARLRAVLDSDSHLGLIGALQMGVDGKADPASRRRDPLLWPSLMSLSGLARLQTHWPLFSGVSLPLPDDFNSLAQIELVDAISGALMCMPNAIFGHLGGFDEKYFLHCEDLDLCRRVRDQGYAVANVNDMQVAHGKGGSSRARAIFIAWHKHRGMWRWFRKYDPFATSVAIRSLVLCGLSLSLFVRLPSLIYRNFVSRRHLMKSQ